MSNNSLEYLDQSILCGLFQLQHLSIPGNSIKYVDPNVFMDTIHLIELHSHVEGICCFIPKSTIKCSPQEKDVMSSCTNLLGHILQQYVVWVVMVFVISANNFTLISLFKQNVSKT